VDRGLSSFLSLRSKPLEILLDLTAFCTCYTPLAANRGSRRISMDYRRCAPKPPEILVVVQFVKPVHRCAMNVCLKARDSQANR